MAGIRRCATRRVIGALTLRVSPSCRRRALSITWIEGISLRSIGGSAISSA